MDADGLIACGQAGMQLTWMDAKVGDWVVTPRIGKPVEVQALWINALAIVGTWPGQGRWAEVEAQARSAFLTGFPDAPTGGLVDVIGPDGVPDRRIRPNQVFAAGGLPHLCVPPDTARAVLGLVEERLLTPLGLRTLDPADPDYRGRYDGGVAARDSAYHQGTVWPWLLGAFVEAWLRLRGGTDVARAEAAARFLPPLRAHLHAAGLGSVSEIADGDAPYTPRGCPFQAWSIGEMLRIEAMLKVDA
jgi:predicted glycogen debranching enzyme